MKTIINKILPLFLALTSLFFILVESQFKNLTESVSAPWQMYFHDPETPIMEGIINFHDKAMCLITFIVFAVGYILFRCVVLFENKNNNRLSEKFIHGTAIEIIRINLPALVLLNLAVPFTALTERGEGNVISQEITVKEEVVTLDSSLLDIFFVENTLLEVKTFMIINKELLLAYSIVAVFMVYKRYIKPKPSSGSEPGSDGLLPSGSEPGSDSSGLAFLEARTGDSLDYSCEASSASPVKDLCEDVNFSSFIRTNSEYASEALGEEEKFNISNPANLYLEKELNCSNDDLDYDPYMWEDMLRDVLEEVSTDKRSFLIKELLYDSDSPVQIKLIGDLVDFYKSSSMNISYWDCIEGLCHAFNFCNDYNRSNFVINDNTTFVEVFTNIFLIF